MFKKEIKHVPKFDRQHIIKPKQTRHCFDIQQAKWQIVWSQKRMQKEIHSSGNL